MGSRWWSAWQAAVEFRATPAESETLLPERTDLLIGKEQQVVWIWVQYFGALLVDASLLELVFTQHGIARGIMY